MDKYFIFVDNNLINGIFEFTASILLTIIILIICKKIFKFNGPAFIWFLFIIARMIIGGKIMRSDNTKFINSSIHSVIVERVERRAGMYRNKLKNGLTFYAEEVSMGDSIVKNANSNMYQRYEKNYDGIYELMKEYDY